MLYEEVTAKIIASSLEVHQHLGPGLLESVYQSALCLEFADRGILYQSQWPLPVTYKGTTVGQYRIDFLIENKVVLELKSTERNDPLYEAQLLSYMKLGSFHVGLLINFNSTLLSQGIKRFAL